jgi:hypothetical protein
MTEEELDQIEADCDRWLHPDLGAIVFVGHCKNLVAEVRYLRQRMRTGWRLVEREGIDPRQHPPADIEPLDIAAPAGP